MTVETDGFEQNGDCEDEETTQVTPKRYIVTVEAPGLDRAEVFTCPSWHEVQQRCRRMEHRLDESHVERHAPCEEISLNVMAHGGETPGRAPEMDIAIESSESAVTIEVADGGRPFNPIQEAPPVPDISPGQTAPLGGLGIHLVKKMVESLSYHHDGTWNRLTMTAPRDSEP